MAASRASSSRWAPRQNAAAMTGVPAKAWARAARWRGRCEGSRSTTTARATSSWRTASRSSASRRTKPCSIASSRPAERSPSSSSVPRRGSEVDRGGRPLATPASKAAAATASSAVVMGRSAGASSRRRRRHSGERRVSRAATRSASVPVRVALRSSRRAATSSSTTSGEPPDRSATRTTIDADGRSPSMPSMSPAISRRARGPRSTRTGGLRPAPMTARFSRSGCSRVSRSGWNVSTSAIRSSRAIRARNVANARVAASATWRSSSTSTTGRSAERRPSHRSSASRARG